MADADVRSQAELTEAAASGIRWIGIARVSTEVVQLSTMVLLARLIPPAEFGMFAVAIIVQELAIVLPTEGVGSAIVQRASIDRAHLQGGMVLSLAVGAALALVTALLAFGLVDPVFGGETASLVLLATPWFLAGAVLALPVAVLRRELDFRRLGLLDVTQTGIRSAVAVVLATVAGLDASALVLGGLAGAFVATALALRLAPVPLPRWRRQAMRDLLPYGGPAALACVAWTGFRNGDYAIVGARLGTAQAGFYWRGFQLAVEYQRKVSAVMAQVAFPVLSRTGDKDEMLAMRRRMVQLLGVVLFPLLAVLVLTAPDVVPWLFGEQWEPAVVPTQILAGAGVATIIIDAIAPALMAEGRSKALLGYGVAHFAVYVSIIWFAASGGLTAVSIAAVSVHAVFIVVAYMVLVRRMTLSVFRMLWEDIAPATASCAALVGTALPTGLLLADAGAPGGLKVAAVSAVAAVAYLAALRAWFPVSWRDLSAALGRFVPSRPLLAVRRRLARQPA